jgi:hypothetical protein
MNTPQATSAVIGWIDIRPDLAAPELWMAPETDDLRADLCRLADKPLHASGSLPSKTARFAPRAAGSSFAPAGSSGAIGQMCANLAELSRELDARLAEIRARLSIV